MRLRYASVSDQLGTIGTEGFEPSIRLSLLFSVYTPLLPIKLRSETAIQANLGCRIGDILHLSLSSLVRDGDHYRMDIIEEKTGKARRHQVPEPVYIYIRDYCAENGINPERRIFQFTERAVQKALKAAREYLDMPQTSTHSFRKFAGQQIYKNSGHDIEATREFFQHASVTTTQKYLAKSSEQLAQAINKSVHLPVETD